MNLKTSPELRARIEASAELTGLSLTQEVERRLEESYRAEDRLGGPRTAAMLKGIATAIASAEAKTGQAWDEDTPTWHTAWHIARMLMEAHQPIPENARAIILARDRLTRATETIAEAGAKLASEFGGGFLSRLASGPPANPAEAARWRQVHAELDKALQDERAARAALDEAFRSNEELKAQGLASALEIAREMESR